MHKDFEIFLRARLQETEDKARAAILEAVGDVLAVCEQRGALSSARYFVNQNPVRTIRRVKASRKIMLEHFTATAYNVCLRCSDFEERGGTLVRRHEIPGPCNTLRYLAEEFSDHPDYKPEWAVVDDKWESYDETRD